MKFVCNFYVYALIIVFTREIWVVRCTTDFDVVELKYLSDKLDPAECLKLLDAVYQKTSIKPEATRVGKLHKAIRRNLRKSWVTRENCLFQLENWHEHFPGKKNAKGREVMKEALRSLGRPDLARHIIYNQEEIHYIERIQNIKNPFGNNGHDMSRRHVFENGKELEFLKNKYMNKNEHGEGFHYQLTLENNANSSFYPTQLIKNREILKQNHNVNEKQEKINKKASNRSSDIYWIILITVIALVIMSICATGIFVIYKRNCSRLINGQLCQEWGTDKDGKKICICCCGKGKEWSKKSYSDIDMESGWSGRCSKCWVNSKGGNYEKSRSKQEAIYGQKTKTLKKKKKHVRTKEKTHKKDGKEASRNKPLEKETKTHKYKRPAISEYSQTDIKEVMNKTDCLLQNDCKCCQCTYSCEDQGKFKCLKKKIMCEDTICNKYKLKQINDLSPFSENETSRKEMKKERELSSRCTSPQLRDKNKIKKSKNKEKLFQYDSSSPCTRKTCEWRKIAKEKRHGKNSV